MENQDKTRTPKGKNNKKKQKRDQHIKKKQKSFTEAPLQHS
jgi:hypothetical protein